MNKLLDYIRRLSPLTIVLVSLFVGVLFGLMLLGWCIFPVQWYDTDPEDLRLEHRKEYLIMTADSYALTDDAEQARQRLGLLAGTTRSAEDIAAILDDLVEERPEFPFITLGSLAELGFETFDYHLVVDGQNKDAVGHAEDVLE